MFDKLELLTKRNNALLFAYKGAKVDNLDFRTLMWKHIKSSVESGINTFVVFARDSTGLSDVFNLISSEIVKELKKAFSSLQYVSFITSNSFSARLEEIKGLGIYDNTQIIYVKGTYTSYLAELIAAGVFQRIICYLNSNESLILKSAQINSIPVTNIYDLIYPHFISAIRDENIRRRYRILEDQKTKIMEMLKLDLPIRREFQKYSENVEYLLRKLGR